MCLVSQERTLRLRGVAWLAQGSVWPCTQEEEAGLGEMFPVPNKEGWYPNISTPGEGVSPGGLELPWKC